MTGRISLLSIGFDMYDTKEASKRTYDCLMEESFNLVYLVDAKLCMEADRDEELGIASLIDTADLVLPANQSTETSVAELLGHTKGSFSVRDYFDELFSNVETTGMEAFVLTDTEDQLDKILTKIHTARPYLSVQGDSVEHIGDDQFELVANAINSVAPDLLIVCLDDNVQINFLKNYKAKINVNLCISAGPSFHNLWIKNKKKIYTIIINTIFKKRVKKDNSKKEKEDERASEK